jgi:hypothetical protein
MLLPAFERRREGCAGMLLMRWVRRSQLLQKRIGALDLISGSGRRNMCCRVRGMLEGWVSLDVAMDGLDWTGMAHHC